MQVTKVVLGRIESTGSVMDDEANAPLQLFGQELGDECADW